MFCDFRILEIYEINVPKCVADRLLYLVIPSARSGIFFRLNGTELRDFPDLSKKSET